MEHNGRVTGEQLHFEEAGGHVQKKKSSSEENTSLPVEFLPIPPWLRRKRGSLREKLSAGVGGVALSRLGTDGLRDGQTALGFPCAGGMGCRPSSPSLDAQGAGRRACVAG